MTQPSPLKWFEKSPDIIRLALMLHVRFALSLRKDEELLRERGIDIRHDRVLFW